MNQDSEDFDSLRRLLALKRYETPPPGYFNRFPREVMARIKAGESGGAVGMEESSWFGRLLSMFDIKPVFAGAFGMAVCAFIVAGVVSSEQAPAVGIRAPSSVSPSIATAIPTDDYAPAGNISPSPVEAQVVAADTNSGSLFKQFTLQPRQASFYLPGN